MEKCDLNLVCSNCSRFKDCLINLESLIYEMKKISRLDANISNHVAEIEVTFHKLWSEYEKRSSDFNCLK